ncbi:hypothetical protein CEXT_405401, partial [Caerostris extrusa]
MKLRYSPRDDDGGWRDYRCCLLNRGEVYCLLSLIPLLCLFRRGRMKAHSK